VLHIRSDDATAPLVPLYLSILLMLRSEGRPEITAYSLVGITEPSVEIESCCLLEQWRYIVLYSDRNMCKAYLIDDEFYYGSGLV
jgi:hypothetical protein